MLPSSLVNLDMNKPSLKDLIDFQLRNQSASQLLAEYAGRLYDDSAQPIENTASYEHFCSEGWLTKAGDQYLFASANTFEWFYAIQFTKQNFDPSKELAGLTDQIHSRLYREKSKIPAVKLTTSFSKLCYICIHNIMGFDLIDYFIQKGFPDSSTRFHFNQAVPFLQTNVTALNNYLLKLEQEGEEEQIRLFSTPLSELAVQQPVIGEELLYKIEDQASAEIKQLIPSLLIGLSNSKGIDFTFPMILKKIGSQDNAEVAAGLFVLSRITITQPTWERFGNNLQQLIDRIESSDNENIKCLLPENYIIHRTFIHDAVPRLISYSLLPSILYQKVISQLVWLHSEHITEPWLDTILMNSARFDYSNSDISNNIKLALLHFGEKNPALTLKFLDCWITTEANEITLLKTFNHEIGSVKKKEPGIFSKWITLSFRRENHRFHIAMQLIISSIDDDGPEELQLDAGLLSGYNFFEIKYILFKILGHVYSKKPLESLTFSIFKRRPFDWNIAQLVANAFTQHILSNYGGTYHYLKNKLIKSENEEKEAVELIIEAQNKYHQSLKELHTINELKWQSKGGVSFVKARMKKMSEDFKKGLDSTSEGSIRSLFKNVSMKGGKGFFSKYQGNYTTVTSLQSIGSSLDLPTAEFIDPVRELINRIEWRKYQLEQ